MYVQSQDAFSIRLMRGCGVYLSDVLIEGGQMSYFGFSIYAYGYFQFLDV